VTGKDRSPSIFGQRHLSLAHYLFDLQGYFVFGIILGRMLMPTLAASSTSKHGVQKTFIFQYNHNDERHAKHRFPPIHHNAFGSDCFYHHLAEQVGGGALGFLITVGCLR
jgi:hypothetical protein